MYQIVLRAARSKFQIWSITWAHFSTVFIFFWLFTFVIWMTVTTRCSLTLEVSVWIMLQDVVCDELDRVVRARFASFAKSFHHCWSDRRLQVGFCWQVVDTYGGLFSHRRKFSHFAYLRICVATFRIKIVFLSRWSLVNVFFEFRILWHFNFELVHHRELFKIF